MTKHIEFIKNKKFKKNILKINFRRKINKNEITKINFLLSLLLMSSKKYQTNRELVLETKNLYNLTPEAFANISGNCVIISFRFTFLMDKYTEENNTLRAVNFIKEVLFNPNVNDNQFASDAFNIVKQELSDDIKTFSEDKSAYSKLRMFEAMDPESPYAINYVGTLEELEKINEKNLYEFYLDMINNSVIDIFALGDIKEEYFNGWKINPKRLKLSHIYKSKERETIKFATEKSDTSQSKLVMGYNMNGLSLYEAKYPLEIYLHILGSGPDSKLFANVREKESLCYNVVANAKYTGSILIIRAGIDAAKVKKTIDIINAQVLDMINGNFQEKDVENAKINIKTGYQEIGENPYYLIALKEGHKYIGYDLLKKRMELIGKVTKEEVMEVAKKIKLNTIFLLEGNKK